MRDGEWATAWAIADAVLASRAPSSRDDPALPFHQRWVWDGRTLDGQDVLVRCYHGLGDTLQFARFLPPLRARAASVTLEVQPELLDLLRQVPGVDRLVAFDVAAPLPSAGPDIEIMELQHALRLPPVPTPYLTVEPRKYPGIGVCWRAGGWDPRRSIALAELRPALPPGAISLQRGEAGLPDPLHGSMSVAETAGLVAGLDAVVTVDTMVAHLAGALGRPCHLLLQQDADWRWGWAPTTPWYTQTRLYRQADAGDWSVPVAALRQALRPAG